VTGKNDSTEHAFKLTLELFGTPEEVREIAKIDREAHTYEEARLALKEVVNKPLTSRSGLQATISNKTVDKILSGKAVDQSFDREAHFLAAANLEKLFSNAMEPFNFDKDTEKNNEHLKAIRRLYAPMAFNGRIVPVKFTVKEMDNERDGTRIYSLEAIDVDLDKK
jgi:cobalamin biosynthesis protein CobT